MFTPLRRPRPGRPAGLSLILCLAAVWFLAPGPAAAEPPDQTGTAMILMEDFVADLQAREKKSYSPEEVSTWQRDWLGRFLGVVFDVRDRATQRRVAVAALGNANVLGEHESAERLLKLLVSISTSPAETAEWQAELGGLQERKGQGSNKTGVDVAKAKDAFESTVRLLSAPGPDGRINPAHYDRIVKTYADLGNLYFHQPGPENGRQAADYYRRGLGVLQELAQRAAAQPAGGSWNDRGPRAGPTTPAEALRALNTTGFTVEAFVSYELDALEKIPDGDRAIRVLLDLTKTKNLKRPVRDHVIHFATSAYPGDAKAYQAFLAQWLGAGPADYDTLIVRYVLTVSYMSTKSYAEASATAEGLYTDAAVKLYGDKEPAAFAERKGGGLADALYVSVQVHRSARKESEARTAAELFLSLFDRDPRAGDMRSFLSRKNETSSQYLRRSSRLHVMAASVALLGVTLAGLMGVRVVRRLRRP
jgi:hypothetical protein